MSALGQKRTSGLPASKMRAATSRASSSAFLRAWPGRGVTVPFTHSALIAVRQCWVSGGQQTERGCAISRFFQKLLVCEVVKCDRGADFATVDDLPLPHLSLACQQLGNSCPRSRHTSTRNARDF